MSKRKTLILTLISGFGLSPSWQGNPIAFGKPTNFNRLWSKHAHFALGAPNLPGNIPSPEICYSSLSCGRKCQDYSESISKSDSRNQNFSALTEFLESSGQQYSSLHLIGTITKSMLKDNFSELRFILDMAAEKQNHRLFIHLFLDDSFGSANEAHNLVSEIDNYLAKNQLGQVASVSGTLSLGDRSDKLRLPGSALAAIIWGRGDHILSIDQAFTVKSTEGLDHLKSLVVCSASEPVGPISDFDSVLFFDKDLRLYENLISSLLSHGSLQIKDKIPKNLHVMTISKPAHFQFENLKIAFKLDINGSIPELVANNNLRQLIISDASHLAYTQQYFAGNIDCEQYGSFYEPVDWDPVTYAKTAKNTAIKLVEKLITGLKSNLYDLIILDLPTLDIIADLADFNESVSAVRIIDEMLGYVEEAAILTKSPLMITSPFGKIESPSSAISTNQVPFIYIDQSNHISSRKNNQNNDLVSELIHSRNSVLDVAPTVLKLLGIEIPETMTGKSLI